MYERELTNMSKKPSINDSKLNNNKKTKSNIINNIFVKNEFN